MKKLPLAYLAGTAIALAGCTQTSGMDEAGEAVSRLQDRIAIEDLIVGYYDHLGSGSTQGIGDYYTDDAVFDVNGMILSGRQEIEGIYQRPGLTADETGDEAETATPAPATDEASAGVAHMLLSNPIIEVNGDQATAKFIWTQIRNDDIKGPPVFVEQGREYDRLVKRDGKWLITKRTVIADSGMPDIFDSTYEPRLNYDIGAD